MSGEFTADVDRIFTSSEVLRDTVRAAEGLLPFWEDQTALYSGWPGIEHDGDDFADEVGPQFDAECEQVRKTLEAIGPGFLNVVELVKQQARDIHRPQLDAIDDIHSNSAGYESDDDSNGRR